MPVQIWVVLIPAVSTILVATMALVRQWLTERNKRDTLQTKARQDRNEELFREYRKLIALHQADAASSMREAARERELRREVEADRDQWRARAVRDERRIEQYLNKEGE